MKSLIALILTVITMMLFVNCSDSSNQNTTEYHDHITDQQENSLEMSLNEGQRWKVNEGMTPHILKAESILLAYLDGADTSYQVLAAELKEQNSKLITSCTMEGKSHDELHKWLHPHIDLIKELAAAPSVEDSMPIIENLKTSFEVYHKYFE
jgi:hypothetical protein